MSLSGGGRQMGCGRVKRIRDHGSRPIAQKAASMMSVSDSVEAEESSNDEFLLVFW